MEIESTQEELRTLTNDIFKELTVYIPYIKESNVNNVACFLKKIKSIECLEELEPRRYL